LGRPRGSGLPRVPRPGGARQHRRMAQQPSGDRDRRAQVRIRHLWRDPAARDAVPPARTDPRGAPPARVRAGRRRRAPLRRHDDVTEAVLTAVSIRKEFGGLIAVNNIDFTVPRGSIVSLIGPNGAGKTTFFNMLTGVYKPTAGRVIFDGQDVTGKPPHAITNRGIGRTFQNIRLFKEMTSI